MKAQQIYTYLRSLNGGWVDPQNTVDTFKAGDSDIELTGIAVSWMSTTWALQQALQLGCNLFITHEPTYFCHSDDDPALLNLDSVEAKRQWIAENGLVVLRCHDLWDLYPGEGILDSWARSLALDRLIFRQGYFRIYDVSGKKAVDIARQVASRIFSLGQEAVQLVGPADKRVTRLAIGTGAITPFLHFVETYQADVALCTDDGITYWRDAAFAIDMGVPLIVVNHAVSEEAGMKSLAKHLRRKFPAIPVHHIPQGCMYRLVPGR